MIDVTVVAAGVISGAAALGGAWLQARVGGRVSAETRRDERRHTYVTVIDLLTDFGWRIESEPDYGEKIVTEFTLPFIHAANRVRLYGSPGAIAAIDELQAAFAELNSANTEDETERAYSRIAAAHDMFVIAARADVGPRKEDRLPGAQFRPGAGPPA